MKMTGEPTLEGIEDYNELKGSKKKIVWTVVITGLFIGVLYAMFYNIGDSNDALQVEKSLKSIPLR